MAWIVRDSAEVEWDVDYDDVAWVEVTDEGALWFLDADDNTMAVFPPRRWVHAFYEDDASG